MSVPTLELPPRKRKTTQFMRVGISGMFATAVDVCALVLLVELAGVYVTIAAFVAALCGGVANYLVNKYWAFGQGGAIQIKQVLVYAAVSFVTGLFVAGAVHLFAVVVGWPYLVAKAIAAALVFVAWTYPAQSKLVFAARFGRAAPDDSDEGLA